jgi:hypothetical protein
MATTHSSATSAAAHASSTSTHPSSAHAASTVTAAATRVVTAMVLVRVRRISLRRLIAAGRNPLATEIHWRVRHGRSRRGTQHAKRKKNTHPHILLPVGISTQMLTRERNPRRQPVRKAW